eukprot:493560-Pelagomonas_calceolata.AAC.1
MSELLDLLLAGIDQPQADQPNSLAEGPPVMYRRLPFLEYCNASLTVDADSVLGELKHNLNTFVMASWTIFQSDAVLKVSALLVET